MAKRRRPKGEGSVFQRPQGFWVFSQSLGKDPETGKRRRLDLYAHTRADLMRKVADERARLGGSIVKPRGVRGDLGQWVERWLEEEKRPNLAASTYAVYEVAWRVHTKPLVGDFRLDRFGPDDVRAVLTKLRAKKVGGRTLQVVWKVMRAAFDAAILQEKYHRPNPWRAVSTPRHDYREPHVLTDAEARSFIEAAKEDAFEAVWLLSLFGGLRLGECLGLKWRDVDLKSGRIDIRQGATEVNGSIQVGKLKTKSSRREIVVGKVAAEALQRRQQAADKEGHKSPFCFTSPTGELLGRTYIRRRHFEKVREAAKIAGLHPHDLRHTMTSHALAAGLSPVVVAKRLGHGSTRMTLDRYGHQLPGAQAEAAAVIEGRLSSAKGKSSAKI
jgi:integrase